MINALANDWGKDNGRKIRDAISKKIGRKLVKGQDSVIIDIVHRVNTNDGSEFMYASVVFDGEVYGFLEVDYSEPCLLFIPSSLLRGIW